MILLIPADISAYVQQRPVLETKASVVAQKINKGAPKPKPPHRGSGRVEANPYEFLIGMRR